MQKDNTTYVLTNFIAQLGIPVTRQSISNELEKHPDYDSLLAYSDVLDRWHVPNAAYQLRFDQLAEVPLPFIAFTTKKQFMVVNSLDDRQAIITNEKHTRKKLGTDEFKKLYGGSVLVAEKDERSGEPDYAQKRKKERIEDLRMPVFYGGALAILLGVVCLHTAYVTAFNLPVALLTLFKTAGLITSVLLLIQSIDTNNPLVQKLCGGDNNKDCNAILSSKAAKVNDYLTWSEVGFFYFAGSWLVLLFNSNHTGILQALALLNIISLPYTFYSVYYQWRVAKQWCVFCCTVQALLWLEAIVLISYLTQTFVLLNTLQFITVAICFSVPVIIWLIIKPLLLNIQQLQAVKNQLRRLKFNVESFNNVLKEQPKYAIPDEDWSIVLGNVEASNVITMVSNPYCQPCSKTHKILHEWLEYINDIQIRIIFTAFNSKHNPRARVVRHLMALNDKKDAVLIKNALYDWYERKQMDYVAWSKLYPVTLDESRFKALDMQNAWCRVAEIWDTPTLLINGYRLPESYTIQDVKYLLAQQ